VQSCISLCILVAYKGFHFFGLLDSIALGVSFFIPYPIRLPVSVDSLPGNTLSRGLLPHCLERAFGQPYPFEGPESDSLDTIILRWFQLLDLLKGERAFLSPVGNARRGARLLASPEALYELVLIIESVMQT
jgi:hypothetical protein